MGIISNLLFGDNSNKTSYKDAAYDKYYRDITGNTFDSMYGGAGGYFDKNYSGGIDKLKSDVMFGLQDQAKNSSASYNASKNNVFGNGIIGGLLNPIAQTVSGVGDLAGLAISGGKVNPWDGSNDPIGAKRDWLSDLGALGETALTVVPMAKGLSLAKAGKAVQAGTATTKQAAKVAASQAPKTLGQKVASGALVGGAYGTAGGLRDMGSENFNIGNLALSAGIGAGIGGGMAGLGGLWNKYTQPATGSAAAPYYGATSGDSSKYQGYLKTLKDNGLDTSSADALKKSYRTVIKPLHTDKAVQGTSNEQLFKTITDAYKAFYGKNGEEFADAMVKATNPVAGAGATSATYYSVPKQSFGEKLSNLKTNVGNTKAGTKISSLLKTKKGKIGLGIGGGLLLSQILGGRNQNQNNMTDEELYNYIVKGEQ